MDPGAAFPDGIQPMAAPLTSERFTGADRVFERKVDGIRLLAFRRGSDVRLLSRRSRHWLKMKCEASQDLVLGGFTEPKGRRVGLGALLVGYSRDVMRTSDPISARSASVRPFEKRRRRGSTPAVSK